MRLMDNEGAERAGRFGSRQSAFEDAASEHAYGAMVLERLARHTCRIAAVDWSCLFVLDPHDPRLAIAAAGCGVSWDLIGTRIGADEGVVGQVLQGGGPALLEDHRDLLAPFGVDAAEGGPGAAVPILMGQTVGGVLCAAVTHGRPSFEPQDMEVLA